MAGLAVGEATGTAGKEKPRKERGRRAAGRRARLGQPRPRVPDGRAATTDARGDRGTSSGACCPPCASIPRRLGARALARARRPGARGGAAPTTSSTGRIEGDDPLAHFSPTAPHHLLRTDGFPHVADLMIGSFYDPDMDEGCAFEELISFHGGLGGPQTEPFILHPESAAGAGGGDHRRRAGARGTSGLAAAAAEPKPACNRPQAVSYSRVNRSKEDMWLQKALGQAGWRSPACS